MICVKSPLSGSAVPISLCFTTGTPRTHFNILLKIRECFAFPILMTVVNVSLLLWHNSLTPDSVVSLLRFLDHTELETQPVRFHSTRDQLFVETATYTTDDEHNRWRAMPSEGFEFANPAIKRLQTYTLGRTALGLTLRTLVKIKCIAVKYIVLLRVVSLSARYVCWEYVFVCLLMQYTN
jgi:hypothetical protein